MYFINIKALKEQHRADQYQSNDSLMYLSATVILTYLATLLVRFPENGWSVGVDAVDGIMVLLSIFVAYVANGGNGGSYFLDKFVSIGWVVLIRLLPVIVLLALVINIGEAAFFGQASEYDGPEDIIGLAVVYGLYTWRLGVHIKDTR